LRKLHLFNSAASRKRPEGKSEALLDDSNQMIQIHVVTGCPRIASFVLLLGALTHAHAATFTTTPAGNQGFDVFADGVLVAPIRLAANGAILADTVVSNANGVVLSNLRAADPLALTFAADDYVSITLSNSTNKPEPVVQFKLTPLNFNTNRWLALFPDGPTPFHFLVCSMPTAQVWHQRGWLNATPYADPFPLLQDVHAGSPEISCLWNRNWSYICPVGGHPIPLIGLWDPAANLYVGYDFQEARASDQSERYIASAYCWRQSSTTNFITLAYPYGGSRYGQQAYPQGGEILSSRFSLVIDTALPSTEDPNERFQARLFARFTNSLPRVPAMNDLSWIPGGSRLADFAGPIGVNLYGPGTETTFYPSNTILLQSWQGHQEMPIDTAARNGDTATIEFARGRMESLLTNYAMTFSAGGESCLFWQKPLSGAWSTNWGGPPVTTLHNSDGWYPARVLVELYRYDRKNNQVRTNYLSAIDGLFSWAKHFVWSRNEFADVPSSPFAIGSTLYSAFLMDYYFTFRNDAIRGTNATIALQLAKNITWRYLNIWAMDSDQSDGALDSSFLIEPNSGRDWAGLGCANELSWSIDSLVQVYVNTGDPRMRYYLRGILQRWPVLYQPNYKASIADYTGSDSLSEGLGLFDGSGPGRGGHYPYGFAPSLPLSEPVGSSILRVVAGAQACIAFCKNGAASDVADYRTDGTGPCSFRIVSSLPGTFDVSFSCPFVDISSWSVTRVRNGQTNVMLASQLVRPTQSPSSLYLKQMQNGDVVTIGSVSPAAPVTLFDTSLVYTETNSQPATNGLFVTVPLTGNYTLPQDWTDLNSFAGIVPGDHWNYGVPCRQGLGARTNTVAMTAPGASVVLVTYAPPPAQTLTQSPALALDDSTTLRLSGQPVLAWRAWPIIFKQKVLMDYAVLPNGRSLSQVNPNGTLVMGVTAFTGSQSDWQPVQTVLSNASIAFVQQELQDLALLALQTNYATLPSGKIALLPLDTAGPAANFAAATGLQTKWDAITEQQLVDTNWFNSNRYPLAFYLGNENYVKTVVTAGDGKDAITRYLAGGGVLVLLASGPFPYYYGYGPADAPGPADPLLPTYGMPFQGFETAPAGIFMQRNTNQTILHSVPITFPFPPGDQRLRAITASAVSPLNRYNPMITALGPSNANYGDAAVFIAFGTGPAKNGKIVYVWSTLLAGPQGQSIMSDVVTWILDATLHPPRPSFNSIQVTNLQAIMTFDARSNLDYTLQYRANLNTGAWSLLNDFSSAPTNRSIRFTDNIGSTSSRYYRLTVGP
jgi:hypothetical protein